MRILLTGGGTGGHFYPLIAIAEEINTLTAKQKILETKLYYMSDTPFDEKMLFTNGITFISVPAGKMRTYSSIRNFFDMISASIGAIIGLIKVFMIYPDVIISKGGYAAFPAVFAGKVLRIPVIIHESDSAPGRLNLWTAKFAERIAVSYPEAAQFFPKEKTAWTGQPVRKEIMEGETNGAYDFYKFNSITPILFIQGGSQGAEKINNVLLEALPELLNRYQVIHQTGVKNFEDVSIRSNLILEKHPFKNRYVKLPFMNDLETKMAAGIATICISRAGSTIFEIALWGIPSIIIPITNSNGDHQRKNAFNYARSGACEVIEEANLSQHLFTAEIDKLVNNEERLTTMKERARLFATPLAAQKIAQEAVTILITHES